MRISVISGGGYGTGNTTVALLLGLGMASMFSKNVCISHATARSESFYRYLGLPDIEDKTVAASQIAKLLKENAIKEEEFHDYCKVVADGKVDIFSNKSGTFYQDDMQYIIDFLLTSSIYGVVIYDIDMNYVADISKKIISRSDVIIINTTQSINKLIKVQSELADEQNADIFKTDKRVIILCNNFDHDICSLRDASKILGVKERDCCRLHRNTLVTRESNFGRLAGLLDTGTRIEGKVTDIKNDIRTLCSKVLRA